MKVKKIFAMVTAFAVILGTAGSGLYKNTVSVHAGRQTVSALVEDRQYEASGGAENRRDVVTDDFTVMVYMCGTDLEFQI